MPKGPEDRKDQGLDQTRGQVGGNLQPIITVITPCLNAVGTITETLVSVQAARKALRRAGWELENLVVEGGSIDGTAELVANHVEKHSCCQILSDVRGGPYAAMNKGLSCAKGRYIHVLNSDDLVLDPNAYARFLVEGNEKGATVLIASIGYFRRPDRQLRSLWEVKSLPATNTKWQQQLLRGLHYPHPGFIADSTIYRHTGFDERYSLSADYKLMQTILIQTARPESTLICRQPLVAMAEGGATGNWKAVLEGRQQLADINQELGIKASSVERYWEKIKQRMRPLSQPFIINSVESPEP